jgi:protein NrfD
MTGDNDRAPYGRREAGVRSSPTPYTGQTYYGRPAIKASRYGWLVATYFFVGGMAGAAQIIAAVADLAGRGRAQVTVRAGRYLALAGVLISPVLLIADLRYPARWYNMLRIFRRTSAMSIGSWTLTAFGFMSSLVALGQAADDLLHAGIARPLTRVVALPAAALGAIMSVYTGALLASTSVPLWASASRLLPALFGASATATAASALALAGEASGASETDRPPLEWLALTAGAAELGLALTTEAQWRRRGVASPLGRPAIAVAYRAGALGLGMIAPLAIHAAGLAGGRRSRAAAIFAAVATLAGGYALRTTLVFAGNDSARRPADYFRFTQPLPTPPAGGRGDGIGSVSATGGSV